MTRVLHAITPGDHFSPRTGSAIPTVVHGLATAAQRDHIPPAFHHSVLVGASTYPQRYESAPAILYPEAQGPTRNERLADVVRGRVGLSRRATARYWAPLASAVAGDPSAVVVAHNAPILPSLLRDSPHRVVLYAHNDLFRTFGRSEAGILLDPVAAIVCVSENLVERTRAQLPRRLHDRVVAVGNGVDAQQFAPRNTIEPRDRLRILFVGRVVAEKGPDVLLEAAASLAGQDVEILVVGSYGFDPKAPLSPYERDLRALADRSPVPVQFLPFVPRSDLPALLAEADILVVPSRWAEPSGLTVGEGMASGLAVIASDVGGIPEVLGDAGILVPPGDPRALAAALADLVADRAELNALRSRARARAVSRDWSWSWSALKRVLVEL
jgi:glycosyltransferase involved in cell wall biosynthesis